MPTTNLAFQNSYAIPDSDISYHDLVQQLPAAIYTCTADGYIQQYNKAAADLWGREPEVGRDLWCGSFRIFHTDGSPMQLDECPMALTLKEGRPILGAEIIVERPDGGRRHVLPHPRPIFNDEGRMVGAVNMLVDITEHKQKEQDHQRLMQHNEQLEEFAYAASHDMQEPLRKITTFATMLMQRNYDQLDENGRNFLTKISQSSNRMKDIITDLLNYSRETKSDASFAPTDLNEILKNVIADLELLIQQKGAAIHYEKLPVIHAVPSQMNRLFYNLLNNSLKFSKPDVAPVVDITLVNDPSKNYIELVVKDNGIGFEQKYAERIFNLFQRLNDRYSYAGNGIGLSLCKKIVENHKGEILAFGNLNQGASFYIKLPR